jgi:hypothetical protein
MQVYRRQVHNKSLLKRLRDMRSLFSERPHQTRSSQYQLPLVVNLFTWWRMLSFSHLLCRAWGAFDFENDVLLERVTSAQSCFKQAFLSTGECFARFGFRAWRAFAGRKPRRPVTAHTRTCREAGSWGRAKNLSRFGVLACLFVDLLFDSAEEMHGELTF